MGLLVVVAGESIGRGRKEREAKGGWKKKEECGEEGEGESPG